MKLLSTFFSKVIILWRHVFINRFLKRHFNLSNIPGNHEKRRQLIIYFCRSIPADDCYMSSMKRQKGMTLPRLVGAQYATGEEWRNNSRKNEETEPKQKQCPVVDVPGDESKV